MLNQRAFCNKDGLQKKNTTNKRAWNPVDGVITFV